MLLADRNPVLSIVVLKTGGMILSPLAGRPVKPDPSPICFPYTVPAEIVEKKP